MVTTTVRIPDQIAHRVQSAVFERQLDELLPRDWVLLTCTTVVDGDRVGAISGGFPCRANHQIDHHVDWYQVGHHVFLAQHVPTMEEISGLHLTFNQLFAETKHSASYLKKPFPAAAIIPVGPFQLSNQPATGSLYDDNTIDGLTIAIGKEPFSLWSIRSVNALVNVYVFGRPAIRFGVKSSTILSSIHFVKAITCSGSLSKG